MSFSMHLLLGISLMMVLDCVDKVQSYDETDVEKLVERFAAFIQILQKAIGSTTPAERRLQIYKSQNIQSLPTLEAFVNGTKELLNLTIESITEQNLRKHSELIEAAIKLFCLTTNGALGDNLRYGNTPLRGDLLALYIKSRGLVNPTAYDAAKVKFNTTVCRAVA